MQHYRVLVEGTGINIEFEPGEIVRGFFATRFVSAGSANGAGDKALALVRESLVSDPTSLTFRSAQLSVSKVEVVGYFARLRGAEKGYTFYVAE